MKKLLLGDEAIAQAALDAGISGVYAYPGTPSTEITEYIQQAPEAEKRAIHKEWSANEKTAMEEALGMSYAGKRVLVCMKHVGLNVAADAFMNAAITGVNGGMVVIVADDPSMHSSQNEQDTRYYAHFANVPLLEPASQQEAYTMVCDAFAFSEEMNVPVVIRITTRLAHSRADVILQKALDQKVFTLPLDHRQFVLLPVNARANYRALVDKVPIFEKRSEEAPYNFFATGQSSDIGIIAAGITYNYIQEVYRDKPCPYPILKISQYPVPRRRIQSLLKKCKTVLVLEEGMPFIEEKLRGCSLETGHIKGRLDGVLPRTGELNPEIVAAALGEPITPMFVTPPVVAPRPPSLCQGCPHCDSYNFLNEVMGDFPEGRVFSDIGCYTLGALPPYRAIHTCVDMGASVTMAKGAVDAGVYPAVSVIGDSTFTHSGITGLLDAVYEGTPVTILILDNATTAMTGGQTSLGTGSLEKIVAGIGVDAEHIRIVEPHPKNHEENVAVLREEIAFKGVSVIIARRACIQIKRKV